jgi:hypothetical protein
MNTAFRITVTSALLLAACGAPQPQETINTKGNIGAACSTDIDCETPMDFLMRSSCPFTSLCINSKCAVVCPMFDHAADPQVSQSYAVKCAADSECDCSSYVAGDMKYCACRNDVCVAVVKE